MINPKHPLIIFLFIETVIQMALMAPVCEYPCESVQDDLCRNLDLKYNLTKFPTKRFISQKDALLPFISFSALVQSNCSRKLAPFLCFYYFPPCLPPSEEYCDFIELDPCQNLCEEVKQECEPLLKDYNQTWNLNCSKLPPTQPCTDVPTISEPTSNPTVPKIDMCYPINDSVCTSLHPDYTATFFPNQNFNSREAADLHFQSFSSFLNHDCSEDLKLLLCGTHYPVCVPEAQDHSTVNVVYPCKNVCNKVRRKCEQFLLNNNSSWPDLLNCSTFPSKSDGLCMDSTLFDTKEMPNSNSKCEPIDPRVKSICGILDEDYKWTHFPHGDFKTQKDAYKEFKTYSEILNSNCSAEMLAFLCYHHFPSCSPDQEAQPKVPCRSVCRKARNGCESCLKKWPDHFDCDYYSVKEDCVTLKDIDNYTSTFTNKPCK